MCAEGKALQRVIEEIGEWPRWYDVAGVERVCDVIVGAVIAGMAAPAGVEITAIVTVYGDGEALLVFVAQVEGDEDRPVVLGRTWLNFRCQSVEEVVGEAVRRRGGTRGWGARQWGVEVTLASQLFGQNAPADTEDLATRTISEFLHVPFELDHPKPV